MNNGVWRKRSRRGNENVVLPIVSRDNKLLLKRKKIRKRQRKKTTTTKEDFIYFVTMIVSITTCCFGCTFFTVNIFFSFISRFNKQDPHKLNLNIGLYDEINELFTSDSSKHSEIHKYIKNNIESSPFELSSVYGPNIERCELTVVLMDPRLPMQSAGAPIWFTLESIGSFASYACVTLQTSSCEIIDEFLLKDSHEANVRIAKLIYERSMPMFRKMIENGQVRFTNLNHLKYKLKSCSNFWNPSWALMNINYWKDEFLDGVDSDSVLFIQNDAVLCHHFDVKRWSKFSFVGGVWPGEKSPLNPRSVMGMCREMPELWKLWILPQKLWRRQEDKNKGGNTIPKPNRLLEEEYPQICQNGIAPIGNGGLSFRSRNWMTEAISICPHVRYSGLDAVNGNYACKVFDNVLEDVYFGVVLLGIRAPLPNAFEASLFSSEMMLPEDVVAMFGATHDQKEVVTNLWGKKWSKEGLFYRGFVFNNKTYSVPIGMHKPWWYMPNHLLLGNLADKCPFLPYIYNPLDSGWKEPVNENN